MQYCDCAFWHGSLYNAMYIEWEERKKLHPCCIVCGKSWRCTRFVESALISTLVIHKRTPVLFIIYKFWMELFVFKIQGLRGMISTVQSRPTCSSETFFWYPNCNKDLKNCRCFGQFSSVFDRKWSMEWKKLYLRPTNMLELDVPGTMKHCRIYL
jgi:hypothetical protein